MNSVLLLFGLLLFICLVGQLSALPSWLTSRCPEWKAMVRLFPAPNGRPRPTLWDWFLPTDTTRGYRRFDFPYLRFMGRLGGKDFDSGVIRPSMDPLPEGLLVYFPFFGDAFLVPWNMMRPQAGDFRVQHDVRIYHPEPENLMLQIPARVLQEAWEKGFLPAAFDWTTQPRIRFPFEEKIQKWWFPVLVALFLLLVYLVREGFI
jgi:hypothetical protein